MEERVQERIGPVPTQKSEGIAAFEHYLQEYFDAVTTCIENVEQRRNSLEHLLQHFITLKKETGKF